MARPSGSNRGRLLLVMLIVSSLLLITLDLRGVSVISGIRSGVGTALAPVEKVGSWVVSPFKNFFSDLFHLGRTRSTIEKLKEEKKFLNGETTQLPTFSIGVSTMPTPVRAPLITATPRRSKVISNREETIKVTSSNRPRLLPDGRAITLP